MSVTCPRCGHDFNKSENMEPDISKSNFDEYPLSEMYSLIDAMDIYKSEKLWIAFVNVKTQYGNQIRLY